MNDASIRMIFMQIPFLVTVRDDHNHTLLGNLVLAKFAGFKQIKKLEGLSDFDAPWSDNASIYSQHDQDAFNGIIYKQFEPCMTADGYKVLLVQKIPLKNKCNGIKAVIGVAIEITEKEIVSTIHLIEKKHSLTQERALIVSSKPYIQEKFPTVNLSTKDIECIYYILRGRSSKVIANYYHCSCRTIEARLDTLKAKFECPTKQMFIEKLAELGFMSMIPESILSKQLGYTENILNQLSLSEL